MSDDHSRKIVTTAGVFAHSSGGSIHCSIDHLRSKCLEDQPDRALAPPPLHSKVGPSPPPNGWRQWHTPPSTIQAREPFSPVRSQLDPLSCIAGVSALACGMCGPRALASYRNGGGSGPNAFPISPLRRQCRNGPFKSTDRISDGRSLRSGARLRKETDHCGRLRR